MKHLFWLPAALAAVSCSALPDTPRLAAQLPSPPPLARAVVTTAQQDPDSQDLAFRIEYPASEGFGVQMLRCGDVGSFQVSVTGVGMANPLFATGATGPNNVIPVSATGSPCAITTTVTGIPYGKARIAKVIAYTPQGSPVAGGTMMGIFDVSAAPLNATISLTTTPTAQVAETLLSQGRSLLLSRLDFTAVQAFVNSLTGADNPAVPNSFAVRHPTLVNAAGIANDLFANNGNVNGLSTTNASYVAASGNVAGTVTFDGSMTFVKTLVTVLRDPASLPQVQALTPNAAVPATTPFTVNTAKAGSWNLDVGVAYDITATHKTWETTKRVPGVLSSTAGVSVTFSGIPHFAAITPEEGVDNELVTINGTNLNIIGGMKFNGIALTASGTNPPPNGSYFIASATQLKARAPANMGVGPLEIYNAIGAAKSLAFRHYKWKFAVTGGGTPSLKHGPASGPDGSVYFANHNTSATARLFHRMPAVGTGLTTASLGAIDPAGSPAVAPDGSVYLATADGNLWGYFANGTAKTGWSVPFDLGDAANATPAVDASGNIYIGGANGVPSQFYALNPDKTQKWVFASDSLSSFHSPVLSNDGLSLYVTDSKRLYARNAGSGAPKWTFVLPNAEQVTAAGGPAVGSDGTLYFGTDAGKFYAVTDQGGSPSVRWETLLCPASGCTPAPIDASPAIGAGSRLYIGSDDNHLYTLEATTGQILNVLKTGDDIRMTPTIGSDGVLYFGSLDGRFYAVGPDGREIWNMVTSGQLTAAPVLENSTLYLATADGKLYSLKVSSPSLAANAPWPKFHKNNRNSAL